MKAENSTALLGAILGKLSASAVNDLMRTFISEADPALAVQIFSTIHATLPSKPRIDALVISHPRH